MNMPCPCKVDCPGTDSPFENITAEVADVLVNIGYSWGWNNNVPPIGTISTNPPPVCICASETSQLEADLCAAQCQINCMVQGNCPVDPIPPPGPGPTNDGDPWNPRNNLYQNAAAFCTVPCPDGNPFTFTVRSGLFTAMDQITADRMAIALACQEARLNAICLTNIVTTACFGLPYLAEIDAQGGLSPYHFQIQGGNLPPGIGFFQETPATAFLSGQASAMGSYTFTIRVTDSRGNFMAKTYTISVMDIVDRAAIPKPIVGTPYSYQIQMTGGMAPYQFINATNLPIGISVSQSGLISGTATVAPGNTFGVTVLDSAGAACQFTCTWLAGCSFFNTLIWDDPPDLLNTPTAPNTGTIAITYPAANAAEIIGFTIAPGPGPGLYSVLQNFGLATKPAVDANCTIKVEVKSASGGVNSNWALFISDNDPPFDIFFADGPVTSVVGTTLFPVTIPATTTHVAVLVTAVAGGLTASASIDVRFDFGV
jgi:hypothetical protein